MQTVKRTGMSLLTSCLAGLALGGVREVTAQQIFILDLAGTPVGEIPSAIKQTKGMLEVVIKDGLPMLQASASSEFVITLPPGQVLPEDFTLEFDLVPKPCCAPHDLSFEGTATINQGAGSAHILWDSDGYLAIIGGGGENYEAPMPEELRTTLPGVLTRVVAVIQGPTVRLYTNGRRHYTLDKRFARGNVLRVFLGVDLERADPVHLAGLRIVAGAFPPGAIASNPSPPEQPGTKASLTIMSDGTAPSVSVSSVPAGVMVSYSLVPGARNHTICRESPAGSACTPVSLGGGVSVLGGIASQWDLGLAPGSSHAYRVTATRPDGRFGESAPVTGVAGPLPAPGNLRVLPGSTSPGSVVLGWDPVLYSDNRGANNLATYQVSGSGFNSPQAVNGTQVTIPLSSGPGTYQWKVAATFANPAGGWHTSATPAVLDYDYAPPPPPPEQPGASAVTLPARTIALTEFTGTGGSSAMAARSISLPGFTATGALSAMPPRTIALTGFTASGGASRMATRTVTLSGFTAAGGFAGIAPRTIALSGFTASGGFSSFAPRTVSLSGFTAAGDFPSLAPRTITLPGLTAVGRFTILAPRTITLPGWTAVGPITP